MSVMTFIVISQLNSSRDERLSYQPRRRESGQPATHRQGAQIGEKEKAIANR